jgi:hypothetical protein
MRYAARWEGWAGYPSHPSHACFGWSGAVRMGGPVRIDPYRGRGPVDELVRMDPYRGVDPYRG